MQNKIKTVIACGVLLLSACTGDADFREAITHNRELATTPVVGKGLPFFTPHTLTPTWGATQDVVTIPPFQLTNQFGKSTTQSIFDHKITIVGFIFTSCRGICPILVQDLKQVEDRIGSRPGVQYVLFSVDPDEDHPAELKSFAALHHLSKNWTLLTGDKTTIYMLARDTFAGEVRHLDAADLRKFAHTEHFYVIDQHRRLRAILNGTRIDLPTQAAEAINTL